jgi:predicted P-loop ATPase
MASSLQDIVNQMAECGIEGPLAAELEPDGKYHRFRPAGAKTGKKSGWYKIWEYRTKSDKLVYVGAFGKGPDTFKIRPSDSHFTTEERAEFAAAQKARQRELEKQAKDEHAAAAAKAQKLWDTGRDEGTNEYLDRKKVPSFGLKFLRDMVMVPLRDTHGMLHGVQYISPDGSKRFNTGLEKVGKFHIAGAIKPGIPIAFAEGYATAASIHKATNYPVVVCFDAGNIEPVANALRPLYPDHDFLFCGDDDRHLRRRLRERLERIGVRGDVEPDGRVYQFGEGDSRVVVVATFQEHEGVPAIAFSVRRGDDIEARSWMLENAGRKAAQACAKRFKGLAVFPSFSVEHADGTDFNDLHLAEGLGVVRSQILAGIKAAKDEATRPKEEKKSKAKKEGSAAKAASRAGEAWRAQLLIDRGDVSDCLANVYLILKNRPEWQGVIAFDEFSLRVRKLKTPPVQDGDIGEWEDADDSRCAIWLSQQEGITPSSARVAEAAYVLAKSNPCHPVRDFLRSMQPWDGHSRIDEWLCRYVGAEDSPYVRKVARYYLLGMIARVMAPGCKFDYCLVLEGEQGKGKSGVFRVLGGEWSCDTDLDLHNKDAMGALQGVWVYELAEMGSITRAEASKQKSFLTRQTDKYRPSYARRDIKAPRQCVFGGTINEWEWNKDPTGGRRFWPVYCKVQEIDLEGLAEVREQLLAEALVLYDSGERFWPDFDEQRTLFDPEQLKREKPESFVDGLHDWVFKQVGEFSLFQAATEGLKMDAAKLTRDTETRIGIALKKLGCGRKEKRNGMTRYWYTPPPKAADEAVENDHAEHVEAAPRPLSEGGHAPF